MNYFLHFVFLFFLGFVAVAQTIPKKPKISFIDVNDKRTFEQAKYFLDLKDFSSALPMFEELVEIYNTEPLFKYNLVECYMGSNNEHKSAIPLLKELKQLYPKSPELFYWLGKAYMYNYEFDNAINELEYFVKNFANDRNAKLARLEIQNCKHAKEVLKNPNSTNVVNLGNKVNTLFSEYAPVIVEEDRLLYFTFRGDSSAINNPNYGLLSNPNSEYYEDVYFSKQMADGNWDVPLRAGEPFNTNKKTHHDASVAISANRQFMFVYKNKNDKESGNLIMLKKNGNNWEFYKDLEGINSSSWEGSACMTADERFIYFSSDRPGTLGDKDLWRAVKQADGSYGAVTNLGNKINTPFAEDAPFISYDGKLFFFSSQGHNSIGGYDLFYCEIKPDGTLGNPINMGFPINSLTDDIYLSTTYDGKLGYFASNRPGSFGQLDLYQFETGRINQFTHLYTLTGTVKWGDRFAPCNIQVFDEKGELESTFQVAEHDGLFKLTLSGGEKYKLIFGSPDFEDYVQELDLKNLKADETKSINIQLTPKAMSVAKLESQATEHDKKVAIASAQTKKTVTSNASQEQSEIIVELSRVFFDYDQTLVKAEFTEDLNNLALVLKKNKYLKLTIIGHTDSKGSDNYNLNLSRRRATAVANYLVVRGVSRSRMKIVAKGESEPLVPNENADGSDSPLGRAKNRRVEFEISNAKSFENLRIDLKNNWPK